MKKKKTQQSKYKLSMIFNGETFNTKGDDLKLLVEELKPDLLQTEIYVIINSIDRQWERKLDLIKGKKLFNNKDYLSIFINNLI